MTSARWKALSGDSEEKKHFEAEAFAQKAAKRAWLATELGKKWAAADDAKKQQAAEKKRKKAERHAQNQFRNAKTAEEGWINSKAEQKKQEILAAI